MQALFLSLSQLVPSYAVGMSEFISNRDVIPGSPGTWIDNDCA